MDWYFQTRFRPADGLGIFQDGQLVCDLHLSPRRIKIRQQSYPSAYLIALATAPAHRRLGLAKKLLTYALRHLVAKGIFFTFLLPFNTEFYTRLGWGEWADHHLYYLPPTCDRTVETAPTPTSGSPWRFHQIEPEQKLLGPLYEHSFAHIDGGWNAPLRIGHASSWTILYTEAKLGWPPTQQALPRVTPVLPPSEGRPILRELITLEPTIKRPFLDYLAATLAGVSWSTTAEIASASVDINHTQQLCPENGATELTPYIPPGTQPAFLGRITSVVPMLEARTYPPLNTEWVMDVTDPLLPENSGQYQIKLAAGKMQVCKNLRPKTDGALFHRGPRPVGYRKRPPGSTGRPRRPNPKRPGILNGADDPVSTGAQFHQRIFLTTKKPVPAYRQNRFFLFDLLFFFARFFVKTPARSTRNYHPSVCKPH